MRILIVEDEALLANRLATTLGERGYAVDVARDGEHGDFLAGTEHYDAVILDLGLPRVDGLTLLERWRAGGIGVPVLVLTARGSWSEKVRGIDSGADDYLTKPFQMEELLARLRALIRRSSGQLTPELRHGAVVLDPRTSQVRAQGSASRSSAISPSCTAARSRWRPRRSAGRAPGSSFHSPDRRAAFLITGPY